MSDERGQTNTDEATPDGPEGSADHDSDGVDTTGRNGAAASAGAAGEEEEEEATPDEGVADGAAAADGESADREADDSTGAESGAEDDAAAGEGAVEDGGTVDDIAERVADADPDAVAAEIFDLREEVWRLETALDDLAAERDDLEDRLKRKVAEFRNYKKRQEERREEVRERATEALVEELLEVRDNLDRALEQDADADIRDGVDATFRQLDEILAGENVEAIEPAPGSEVDPARHEVLLNVESDQPDGTVAEVHRSGYEMAGKVLRPAQVTVAEGEPD